MAYYIAAMDEKWKPKKVYIHTANHIGGCKMVKILEEQVDIIEVREAGHPPMGIIERGKDGP